MCNQEEVENAILTVLEKDFHYDEEKRAEALILALQALGYEELPEQQ